MKPDNALRRRAAERARLRAEFLGWILVRYAEIEGLDDLQVRKQLGVSVESWTSLNLCLRPRPEHFLKDVTAIAKECEVDRDVLAKIIRRVEAIDALEASENQSSPGSLLATPAISPKKRGRSSENQESPGSLLAARTRKKDRTKNDDSKGGRHGS